MDLFSFESTVIHDFDKEIDIGHVYDIQFAVRCFETEVAATQEEWLAS
jgi:hypothetical protein